MIWLYQEKNKKRSFKKIN